jgi:hypothetical protein
MISFQNVFRIGQFNYIIPNQSLEKIRKPCRRGIMSESKDLMSRLKDMNTAGTFIINRMIRAAKLDKSLYEEVEADKESLGQAMAVVTLSAVAAGIGNIGRAGLSGILIGMIAALLGWYIWAYITYFVGTKLLPEPQTKADHGELLRTIGFSAAPGVIRILGVLSILGGITFIAASIWMLVAMVVAVKQALDYQSIWRAIGVCLIGWVIQIVILMALFAILGATGRPL